jgi:quinol monooxygenase YgiN
VASTISVETQIHSTCQFDHIFLNRKEITMLVIMAILEARPGQEKALQEALHAMIPQVQKETGTLIYTLHQSTQNPGRFFFYEQYVDQAAVDHHLSTPYFKALFAQFPELLNGEPHVEFYTPVAGIER